MAKKVPPKSRLEGGKMIGLPMSPDALRLMARVKQLQTRETTITGVIRRILYDSPDVKYAAATCEPPLTEEDLKNALLNFQRGGLRVKRKYTRKNEDTGNGKGKHNQDNDHQDNDPTNN